MASISLEVFSKTLVNVIDEAIAARENTVLKALLQFQDNILQELLSLKQCLELQTRYGYSSDSNCNCVSNAPDQLKDSVLTSLSRQTVKQRDSFKRTKLQHKFQCNSSKPEKNSFCNAQVFQKDLPSNIKLELIPNHNSEKSVCESDDMFDETRHQKDCDRFTPAAKFDSSLSSTIDIDTSLSSVAELNDHIDNFSTFPALDTEEFCANNSTKFLESTVPENVIIASENINDFYVELKNLSENSNCSIDFSTDEISNSNKFVNCKSFEGSGYRCGFCDKIYEDHNALDVHLSSHLNRKDKRYKCLLCGIFCTSKSTMHKHLFRHNGKKPFKCKICGRAFNIKYSLKRHLMTHTGEKPFGCSVCNKAFARKDYRDVHERSHWCQSGQGTESNTFQFKI